MNWEMRCIEMMHQILLLAFKVGSNIRCNLFGLNDLIPSAGFCLCLSIFQVYIVTDKKLTV